MYMHPSTHAPEDTCGRECHDPLLSLTSVLNSINEPCLWVCQIRERGKKNVEKERENQSGLSPQSPKFE